MFEKVSQSLSGESITKYETAIFIRSAKGDGIVLLILPRQVFTVKRYLLMELSNYNYVILRTNRARCALNKKILNLLNEEIFLEKTVVELVYKFVKKYYRECLKR